MANIHLTEATQADVASLATVEVRAFHKDNEYHRKCFPDTPLLSKWWSEIISSEIDDPTCIALAAIDRNATDEGQEGIAILLLRRMEADEEGCGVYTNFPLTPDHDRTRCDLMFDSIKNNRKRIMTGRRHYLLEYFGVDDKYKGIGIGTGLLKKACETVDQEGLEILVLANMFSRSFYERLGFELQEQVLMPGPEKYMENLLIRKAGASMAIS